MLLDCWSLVSIICTAPSGWQGIDNVSKRLCMYTYVCMYGIKRQQQLWNRRRCNIKWKEQTAIRHEADLQKARRNARKSVALGQNIDQPSSWINWLCHVSVATRHVRTLVLLLLPVQQSEIHGVSAYCWTHRVLTWPGNVLLRLLAYLITYDGLPQIILRLKRRYRYIETGLFFCRALQYF